jgi:hypothetical protein
MRDLIEFNAFAVQYRYDMMDPGEPALNRAGVQLRVSALRDQIALLIREVPA